MKQPKTITKATFLYGIAGGVASLFGGMWLIMTFTLNATAMALNATTESLHERMADAHAERMDIRELQREFITVNIEAREERKILAERQLQLRNALRDMASMQRR